jgi:hypothetical protein
MDLSPEGQFSRSFAIDPDRPGAGQFPETPFPERIN